MILKPSRSFVLVVGEEGALLVPPDGLAAEPAPLFVPGNPDNDSSVAPFLNLLRAHPRVPILLLADTLAQDYSLTTLPPGLGLGDRRKLLQRRLRAAFPHDDLGGVRVLAGQRPRRALLVGHERGGVLESWLTRLETLPNPSGTVALAPLESASLVPQLLPEARKGWGLWVSRERVGGVRQILTYAGELILTRLLPSWPVEGSVAFGAAALTIDLRATLEHLARKNIADPREVSILILAPESEHAILGNLDVPAKRLVTLSPHEAARRLGFAYAPRPDDPWGDTLHALAVRRAHRVILPLQHPATARRERAARIGARGRIAAWVVGLVALLVLGVLGTQTLLQIRANTRLESALMARTRIPFAPESLTGLDRLQAAFERKTFFQAPPPLLPVQGVLTPVAEALASAEMHPRQCLYEASPGTTPTFGTLTLTFPEDTAPEALAQGRATFLRALATTRPLMRLQTPPTSDTPDDRTWILREGGS